MKAGLYERAAPTPYGFRDVTVQQVRAALGGVRLVDVREPHELTGDLGRIDGVTAVPLGTVATAMASWPRDEELVMVCRSGNRSGKAAAALHAMGFSRVMNMVGGMLAWNDLRLAVKR